MDLGQFDEYRNSLADAAVFRHLAAAELGLVLKSCRLIEAPAGQLVLAEGKPGDGLYVILQGEIEFFLPERISERLRRPSRIRLNVLGPGRCFGEYGFIDDQPASAAAQALTPARLCFLPKAALRQIIDREDRIGKVVNANLLRVLVSRLRGKDKELDLFLLDDRPPAHE